MTGNLLLGRRSQVARNRQQPPDRAVDTARMTLETALWLGALTLPARAVAHFRGELDATAERLLRMRRPRAKA